ncbi:hypothetical protein RYA05_02825 [Pseudomonas syringae pv. actinidiae]|nr:hypothetical protein [Pseudomonas syringae pv. actinidiae]
MLRISDLQAGDTVQVRGSFGADSARIGVVSGVEKDINNGKPGIDYMLEGGTGPGDARWAYLDQVDSIVKKADRKAA